MYEDLRRPPMRKVFHTLAAKFRMVGEIEKHHEERYRALLKNVETASVFEKSEVKVWECRNCGHIVIGTKHRRYVRSAAIRRATLKFAKKIIKSYAYVMALFYVSLPAE